MNEVVDYGASHSEVSRQLFINSDCKFYSNKSAQNRNPVTTLYRGIFVCIYISNIWENLVSTFENLIKYF